MARKSMDDIIKQALRISKNANGNNDRVKKGFEIASRYLDNIRKTKGYKQLDNEINQAFRQGNTMLADRKHFERDALKVSRNTYMGLAGSNG